MIKRRSFLGYFSIGWLATCFPIVLAAYAPAKSNATSKSGITDRTTTSDDPLIMGDKDRAKPIAQKKSEGFSVVGSVSDLDKNGYLQTKGVAVLRSASNPNKLIAVNPKCTHQGCDVKWAAEDKKYACPCHGASFDANGEVLNGPATKPLAAYSAKIVGTQVLVAISAPSATASPKPSSRGKN
jgi:cytochrome b6-f complex iron-sulfur subunit